MREVLPRVAVCRIVFSNRTPLALAHIGSPQDHRGTRIDWLVRRLRLCVRIDLPSNGTTLRKHQANNQRRLDADICLTTWMAKKPITTANALAPEKIVENKNPPRSLSGPAPNAAIP